MVAEHLSAEEAAGIKEMFQSMDINNTGRLTLEELKYGLHKLGHQIADADAKILMDAVSFIQVNILLFFFFVLLFVLFLLDAYIILRNSIFVLIELF